MHYILINYILVVDSFGKVFVAHLYFFSSFTEIL